ncbi:MAG TPA: efflux RND transporter periplasmic adaptor subunit [Arenimonas sp.]|uniref:efflux RND transporter periplasmic adaptor subunit n=1 Tax=Arenimonas sp. TaxID=1872635 RepID=UPI002C584BCF|nr:efflux RND transporter periplasmic adaptor subunit [Arenimonas sp.]HMB56825.1 efflux RND transporter periplasmic adaptor subunit [Arenimonas sp.]
MIRDTSAQDKVIAPPPGQANKRRLWLFAGAAVALVAVVVLVSAWRGSDRSIDASRLRIAEVSRGTLVRDASVNGRVVAAVSPTLYAPAESTVTLKIHAGDAVKKGDVLAVLDSPSLSNELAREQSSLEQLEDEVARQRILAEKQKLIARRDADEAEVSRLGAQRILQRTEKGYKAGAIAEVEFLRAQDALKSAEIRSKQAAQASGLEVQDVGLELKTKLSQLQRQHLVVANIQRRVDELSVRAPVDGVIGTLSVADRAVVPANAPLMTVVDLSRLEVELEIPESYADDLGLGMSAEVSIGTLTATGKLSAISPEVVKNQVLARVRFDGKQPDGLRQSQRVNARILIEEKPNVLMLPRGSFVEDGGGRSAYVMDGGIAVRRPVQLGATSVSAVEVLSGLKQGDHVVIAGTDSFDNAERVSVNE